MSRYPFGAMSDAIHGADASMAELAADVDAENPESPDPETTHDVVTCRVRTTPTVTRATNTRSAFAAALRGTSAI